MNNLVFPLIWIYNYIMLIKKDMKEDLVIELSMMGEWWSRGDRGIDDVVSESVNVDKIRRVWDGRKEGEEYDEEDFDIELNKIEEMIVLGDGGFMWDDDEEYGYSKRGFSGCMSRVDDLLEGKSIFIEMEECIKCIGSNNSKEINKVEIDFCKFKIELLKA